jgi:uncharacterized protein (TIGR03085 family)
MTYMSRTERTALCDLALQLGPDAPTLCGDWDVADLVTHLLVRERSPLAVGVVVPQLSGLTERAMARMKRDTDFTVLVERLRNGPPVPLPFGLDSVEARVNTVEFFVHHEDVRRAEEGWSPRDLSARDENRLWKAVRVLGKGLSRKAPVGVVIERADTGERATLKQGEDAVVVRGAPSEITLYIYGRKAQARIELDGSEEAVARLQGTDLGV